MVNDRLAGLLHPLRLCSGQALVRLGLQQVGERLSTYLPNPPRRREKRGTLVTELAPPSLANLALCA